MRKVAIWLVIGCFLLSCKSWAADNTKKITVIASVDALTYICVDGLSFIRAENAHNAIALFQVMDRNGKPKGCENK